MAVTLQSLIIAKPAVVRVSVCLCVHAGKEEEITIGQFLFSKPSLHDLAVTTLVMVTLQVIL